MSLDISRIMDTILTWIEDDRPTLETIINYYFVNRRLTLFFGRWAVIPTPSLPSIEVAATNGELSWFATRVQDEKSSIEVDITVDIREPENANRCLNALVQVVGNILAVPPHLQAPIQGTADYLYKAFPSGVTYRTIEGTNMRFATISWTGDRLNHLLNHLFQTPRQVQQPLAFPKQ